MDVRGAQIEIFLHLNLTDVIKRKGWEDGCILNIDVKMLLGFESNNEKKL